MRRRIATLVVSLVVLTLVGVLAQSNTGQIRGVVRDSTNAATMPGATVRITRGPHTDRDTVTNARGEFSFRGLEPDRYSITASLGGFRSATVEAVVTRNATVDLSLVIHMPTPADHMVNAAPVAAPAPNAAPMVVEQGAEHGYVVGAAGGVAGGVVGGAAGGIVGGLESADANSGAMLPGLDPRFNTEAYDRITDNQWNSVAQQPLSTFSTDVDTASYSNVRRFLKQGQAPPKDAVRIEELINYFSFTYPDPRGQHPVSVTTAIGDCPWNDAHRLALIGLQAKRIDRSQTPPRNLVFLIDVSGSMMAPNKLQLIKRSLSMLAPNLTDNDRLAIVVYAGNTGLVLPSTRGGDTAAILESIDRLEAGGSTNGGAGLALAYKVAQENFIKGGVNRVVLATDGDFNVGVTSQGSLVRFVEEKRDSGVALSVLGYGMGNVKDSTMVKLADAGNGNYAYIDSLDEARKVLVEQAGGTLVTVAKDVKLQIEFNPAAVAAYRLIGYEKRVLQNQDFNNDKKDAGDMGAGHSVTALYELIPAGQPIEVPSIDPLKYQRPGTPTSDARGGEAMTVKIRYKQPDADTSSLLSVAVADRKTTSPALGFAAAVAQFGMLLRDSEHKGSSSFASALKLAQEFRGDDPYGHRAEFIALIGAAQDIIGPQTTAGR